MVPGGMVQQAARGRAGLRRARGDRPGHAHPRRSHGLLELPVQGPRLRDAAGSAVEASAPTRGSTPSWSGGWRWRSAAPMSNRRPALAGWGTTRLRRVTRNRSIEAHLADHGIERAFGEGAGERGPARSVPPDRRERERASRGPGARRAAGAGGRLGGVRQSRDGQQGHVPVLQRRPHGRGPSRVRGGRAPRRPRGPRAGRGARVRERRGRRRVRRPRPLRAGRGRVGRPPRGEARCSRPGAPRGRAPQPRAPALDVALDARVLLRAADPVRQAGRHGRVRAVVPHRL